MDDTSSPAEFTPTFAAGVKRSGSGPRPADSRRLPLPALFAVGTAIGLAAVLVTGHFVQKNKAATRDAATPKPVIRFADPTRKPVREIEVPAVLVATAPVAAAPAVAPAPDVAPAPLGTTVVLVPSAPAAPGPEPTVLGGLVTALVSPVRPVVDAAAALPAKVLPA